MTTLVIDASVAIKWVVEEDGWEDALTVRRGHRLVAPDLLVAECANILWKKVQRGELSDQVAALAAGILERSDIQFISMRLLLRSATEMAVRLNHPAYDCVYLTLALATDCKFVTADDRLVRKIRQQSDPLLAATILTLGEAAANP